MWWQNRKLRTYSHNQQKERIWPWKKINIKKEQENKKNSSTELKKVAIFPGQTDISKDCSYLQAVRNNQKGLSVWSHQHRNSDSVFWQSLTQTLWLSHFNKVLEPEASYNSYKRVCFRSHFIKKTVDIVIFQLIRAIFKCTTELLNCTSLYFNGNVHMRQIRPMKET